MTNKQKKFNKSSLIKLLHQEFPNLNYDDVSIAVDSILNSIVNAIALDNVVEIRGFGTFSKKNIRPRKFINPKTKEVSFIGETSTIHFKPSKNISKIND